MVAAAAKALEWEMLVLPAATAILIAGQHLLSLAWKGRDGCAPTNDVGKETLAEHTAGNFLHFLDLLFRCSCCCEDDGQLRR